jgi:hypothetical protein
MPKKLPRVGVSNLTCHANSATSFYSFPIPWETSTVLMLSKTKHQALNLEKIAGLA